MLDKIAALAREWAIDRRPRDAAERALFVALAEAYPADFRGKDGCSCGSPETCRECPTGAEVTAYIESLRREPEQGVFTNGSGWVDLHHG